MSHSHVVDEATEIAIARLERVKAMVGSEDLKD